MEEIIIDDNLKLIPYYPNQQTTLGWYQDLDVCKQVDNIDTSYTKERLNAIYNYISSKSEFYYIQFNNTLVGDGSLYNGNELAIVISKQFLKSTYWGKMYPTNGTVSKRKRFNSKYIFI